MATLTRDEMHVALDLELEILDSAQMARMDAPIKDYWLNQAVEAIVKEIIRNVNEPDEDKRVPNKALTISEILNKYNTLAPLIIEAALVAVQNGTGTEYNRYTMPTCFHFEGSFTNITIVAANITRNIQNVILDTKGVQMFNDNPFGGGRRYIATKIVGSELWLYHLSRYLVNSVTGYYIANPAVIGPTVNCNLPGALHIDVVKRAAALIAASVQNGNYEAIRNEIQLNKS